MDPLHIQSHRHVEKEVTIYILTDIIWSVKYKWRDEQEKNYVWTHIRHLQVFIHIGYYQKDIKMVHCDVCFWNITQFISAMRRGERKEEPLKTRKENWDVVSMTLWKNLEKSTCHGKQTHCWHCLQEASNRLEVTWKIDPGSVVPMMNYTQHISYDWGLGLA